MTKYSAPWLPEDAAEYANSLRRDPNLRTNVRTGQTNGLLFEFKNDLSKRILLDPNMRPVWKYLNSLGVPPFGQAPAWKYFLIEVQVAARGPQTRDLWLMSDMKSDISGVKKHIKAIKRVIKRYSESKLTFWKLNASLARFEGELKLSDVEIGLEAILDRIPEWISLKTVISPPLSSPNHPDAAYHYFIREVYSFFAVMDYKFNKWSLLARTSNATGLFPLCDSNKARGTCRDLAQEFANPF